MIKYLSGKLEDWSTFVSKKTKTKRAQNKGAKVKNGHLSTRPAEVLEAMRILHDAGGPTLDDIASNCRRILADGTMTGAQMRNVLLGHLIGVGAVRHRMTELRSMKLPKWRERSTGEEGFTDP